LSWIVRMAYRAGVGSPMGDGSNPSERLMRLPRLVVLATALVGLLFITAPASAAPMAKAASTAEATCNLPESDADALVILNAIYPNRYVWSDSHLTVAVAAAPTVSAEQLKAIHQAIETWASVLQLCFDGQITLTDVTGSKRQAADIVVHYVPRAGGTVFGGYAICGANGCPNILVRSDLPPSLGLDPYSPEYLYYVTLHELGHALGLGHATNLLESTDLMGYGWNRTNGKTPVLSQCDVAALAYLFSWALEGNEPPGPGQSSYDATFDCSAA
jgi:predicted Zn-dependent protease